MRTNASDTIQGPVLGFGNEVSPYTVQQSDRVVEFITAGDVTVTFVGGDSFVTTVLIGGRYALEKDIATITFTGTFNVS